MYKAFVLAGIFLAFSISAFGQDGGAKVKPTEKDKTEAIPAGGVLKRGAALGESRRVELADVLRKPEKFAGETVIVEGIIVRSCQKEGCWMELAPEGQSASVRVRFKDHAFFIPFKSAGARATAEGVFSVKIIDKDEADHLIEDGAKFEKRNEDGSVTEITFEASGVELRTAG